MARRKEKRSGKHMLRGVQLELDLNPKRVNRRWTSEEDEILRICADRYTLGRATSRVNMHNRKNGLSLRSSDAIEVRASFLGVSLRPSLDNFTRTGLAKYLGVHHRCVTDWVQNGGLKTVQDVSSTRRRIRTKDFIQFVHDHPAEVKRRQCDKEMIEWLLEEDPEVLQSVQHQWECVAVPHVLKNSRTGEIYQTRRDCAKKLFLEESTVRAAIMRRDGTHVHMSDVHCELIPGGDLEEHVILLNTCDGTLENVTKVPSYNPWKK